MSLRHRTIALLAAALVAAACGSASDPSGDDEVTATSPAQSSTGDPGVGSDAEPDGLDTTVESAGDDTFPDVVDVSLTTSGGTWSVAATISSPYDTPDRYADAFRVLAPDGTELGVRELAHDHAGEQPFTRSLEDVTIPDDVAEVIVQGRDQRNGWGGDTVTVAVPR